MKIVNMFDKGVVLNKSLKDFKDRDFCFYSNLIQKILIALDKADEFEELIDKTYPNGLSISQLDDILYDIEWVCKKLHFNKTRVLNAIVYNDTDCTSYFAQDLDALIEKIILDNPEFEYLSNEADIEYMEEHNLHNVNEYIKYIMLNDKNSIFNLQEVEGYHIKYYTVKINY